MCNSHGSRKNHQCGMCGGAWYSGALNAAKSAVKAAVPHVVAYAKKHGPALAQKAVGVARKHMGLGLAIPPGRGSIRNVNFGGLAIPPGRGSIRNVNFNQGGAWYSGALNAAKSAVKAAVPHVVAYAKKHGPALAQKAVGVARKHVGLGRRRRRHPKYGAMLPPGEMTTGEEAYMGRRGGKLPGAAGMASAALNLIPGAAEALGPFGALLGLEAPPPPPPRATFSAVRAGPAMSARPHGIGRGVDFYDNMGTGGAWYSGALNAAKSAVKAAMPHVVSYAKQHGPAYAQKAIGVARKHMGLGLSVPPARRTRAPTAHSLAVKHVMAQHGMGLGLASRFVKEHGLANRH
jgi:hypothetical protein